jgi:hypothetical protein
LPTISVDAPMDFTPSMFQSPVLGTPGVPLVSFV